MTTIEIILFVVIGIAIIIAGFNMDKLVHYENKAVTWLADIIQNIIGGLEDE